MHRFHYLLIWTKPKTCLEDFSVPKEHRITDQEFNGSVPARGKVIFARKPCRAMFLVTTFRDALNLQASFKMPSALICGMLQSIMQTGHSCYELPTLPGYATRTIAVEKDETKTTTELTGLVLTLIGQANLSSHCSLIKIYTWFRKAG